MSFRQPMDYSLEAAARMRAAAEQQRRMAELTRARTEQAAAIHRETAAIAREHQRLANARLSEQAGALSRHQAELDRLGERARACGVRLDNLEDQLAQSRLELERVQGELRSQMQQLASLEAAACGLETAVRATLDAAARTLSQVEDTARAAVASTSILADAAASGREFVEGQARLEAHIRQLETEIRFVTQRADLAPVAMVTVEAMEQNGYRLRETISRDGLIAYFQKEGAEHQLAVRLAPAGRPGENEGRWDLLAEAFDMKGSACLEELDDFETALAEQGRLRRTGARLYPRDDSQAVLPHRPPRPVRRSHTRDRKEHA
jgi:hypothetical protein